MTATWNEVLSRIKAGMTEIETPTREPPPPEPEFPLRERRGVRWVDRVELEPRELVSIEEGRRIIADAMRRPHEGPTLRVIRAPAGLGKTWAATEFAQECAQEGKEVLFMALAHTARENMGQFPHFKPHLWYPWQSYASEDPSKEDGETMCLYAKEADEWLRRGYKLTHMCNRFCPLYQAECSYRRQRETVQPIVLGVHEHAVFGMARSGFDVGIIDEVPTRAFTSARRIPVKGIVTGDSVGPLHQLQLKLSELALSGRAYMGPALMNEVGDLLTDVFHVFKDKDPHDIEAIVPTLTTPADVHDAPYWYLPDFLLLALPEWMAWQLGHERWAERIIVTAAGMDLLQKRDVWARAPELLIAIDATANVDLYKAMFPGYTVEVYAPDVTMSGRVYQIVDSSYNMRSLVDASGKPTPKAHRVIAMCRDICVHKGHKTVGFVTFMALEELVKKVFEAAGIKADTLHYHGQRGLNALETVDVLFVLGTPSPPDYELAAMTATLNPRRHEPIDRARTVTERVIWTEHGDKVPLVEVSGYWDDPQMATILSVAREEEIEQAVHRARPLIQDSVVYLFSGCPTDVVVTDVFESPSEIVGAPPGFTVEQWVRVVGWIDGQDSVTTKALAGLLGVSPQWVSRQGMLEKIVSAYPGQFRVDSISKGRGRPSKGLVRAS